MSSGSSQELQFTVISHVLLPHGPAHRLVKALREQGLRINYCGLPMLGARVWRQETELEESTVSKTEDTRRRKVPYLQLFGNFLYLVRFGRRLRRSVNTLHVVLCCDPLAHLMTSIAFWVARVRVHKRIVYFVDWSAQRLQTVASSLVYRALALFAVKTSDVVAAISAEAAYGIQTSLPLGRSYRNIIVVPNLHMEFGSGPSWQNRRQQVVYIGSLNREHGVTLLIEVARVLLASGIECYIEVVGHGTEEVGLEKASRELPNLNFRGQINDYALLKDLLHTSKVGLGLYDPDFPMFKFNDPLKIKDYLAAGVNVVSTRPGTIEDGVLYFAEYSVDALAEKLMVALQTAPAFDPRSHPLLFSSVRCVEDLLSMVSEAPQV